MSETTATNIPSKVKDLLEAAIKEESTTQLDEALFEATNSIGIDEYKEFACSVLRDVVHNGSSKLTAHLINSEGVPVTAITAHDLAWKPSIPLLETLVANGWDINDASPKDNWRKGKRTIDRVIGDHEMVVWLVEHGAELNGGEEEYSVSPRPPLLTELCATMGSAKTLKFLLSRGAKLGRRTLHRAVAEAAATGADPSQIPPANGEDTTKGPTREEEGEETRDREYRKNRGEMLRYLVDELRLDVNASDSDVAKSNHHGTPLNYAVRQREGAAVVQWLLQKGANPSLKGLDSTMTPSEIAESHGFADIVEVFNRQS